MGFGGHDRTCVAATGPGHGDKRVWRLVVCVYVGGEPGLGIWVWEEPLLGGTGKETWEGGRLV